MGAPKGSMIFYATSPGDVASEGQGRNGTFTKHLLASMDTPNLTVEQVFKRTARLVSQETGKKQVPWVEGLILGEFYFKVTVEKVPKETFDSLPNANVKNHSKNESLFWSSVKDSQDSAELQAFLNSYPNSGFAPLARIRLKKLQATQSTPVIQSANIQPVLKKHQLTIRSNLFRDKVTIDGKEYGSTKLEAELPAGLHNIIISKAGYEDFTTTVNLQQDRIIRGHLLRIDNGVAYHQPAPRLSTLSNQYNVKVEVKKPKYQAPIVDLDVNNEVMNGHDIQSALNEGLGKKVIGRRIKLYFGSQYAPIIKRMKTVTINKKTNAFAKTAEVACNWAFLGAIKALQKQARRQRANAIVNIKSVYKGNKTSNQSQYQCDKGAFVSRVVLTGQLARVR
jgi:uncharacterized protein YbjQ (UPF0145 family)